MNVIVSSPSRVLSSSLQGLDALGLEVCGHLWPFPWRLFHKKVSPWHRFLVFSYFATPPITLLLQTLGDGYKGRSPTSKVGGPSPGLLSPPMVSPIENVSQAWAYSRPMLCWRSLIIPVGWNNKKVLALPLLCLQSPHLTKPLLPLCGTSFTGDT